MSKLTGWIDKGDSLDVQKIVENYEKELAGNKTNENTNNKTRFMVGDEVWSGSLDDFESLKNQKINSFNSKQLIKDQEKQSSNEDNLINSEIEQKDNCLKNEQNKQIFEPNSKIGTFDQQKNNLCDKETKTIKFNNELDSKQATNNKTFGEESVKIISINNEVEKEIDLNDTSDKFKTINFDLIVNDENNEQEKEKIKNAKDQKVLEINKLISENTKSLENNKQNEQKNTNSFESKTVLFDSLIDDEFKINKQINVSKVNTKIIDDEKNQEQENFDNTRTIKFEQVTKEQNEENEYIKNIPRFNLKENFEKILEESESKTIKFQSTSNNLSSNEQRFTKHLNDMIFNETVNVEDLDLTKELKDVDAIKLKEDSSKKKKSWFFSRKKKNSSNN